MCQFKRHTQTESKKLEKIFHENRMKKKAGVGILISDKTDFKTKAITTAKEGPSNSTSGYLSKETQNRKDIQSYVHCSIICNSQGMETSWVSINR